MGNWRLRPSFCKPWKKDEVHAFRGAAALLTLMTVLPAAVGTRLCRILV